MNLEQLSQYSQIAGAVVFIICVVLIWNKWIAPGVLAYQETKNAELAEAESRREKMRAAAAEARAEVERAGADAKTIVERAGPFSASERAKMLAEATSEAERIVRNAEGELERARYAARDRLRVEFIEKALVRARTQAAARIDAAANAKLVDTLVDGLTQGKP